MKKILLITMLALLYGATVNSFAATHNFRQKTESGCIKNADVDNDRGHAFQTYNLPFVENWNTGSFDTQEWTFDNYMANWQMNEYGGTTAPYVRFNYSPRAYDYSSSLVSPPINIQNAENLTLSLDFSFSDYMSTSTEFFKIFVLNGNNNWIELASYTNNTGEIEWQNLTFELGNLQANTTRIRFEASGQDTDRYNNWNIDNIALSAAAGSANFVLEPLAYNFGEVAVGSTSGAAQFTLLNNGSAGGNVTSISITGANLDDFNILNPPTLPLVLNANESINLQLAFSPTQAGARNANMTILTSNSNLNAELSGTGKTETVYNLPFVEDWSSASYETQNWTIDNNPANWQMTEYGGGATTPPYVRFHYGPRIYNYNSSLISPPINIQNAGNLTLSLDFSFVDYMNTATEFFKIFVRNNNNWIELASYTNEGEIEWQTLTFELGNLQGNTTQIRFEASGQDNDRINDWNIDNIVLSAAAGSANFVLEPLAYNFGEVAVGSTSGAAQFTLLNNGSAGGNVTSISITGANLDDFNILNPPTLPLVLNANESINLQLAFSPTQAGARNANMTILTSNSNLNAELSGTGKTETVYNLPFVEDWSSASYETQNWTIDNNPANWQMTEYGGGATTPPYVRFHYGPRIYNYNSSLISPPINIQNAGNLTLSLDFSFVDYMNTATEFFKIFVRNNNNWIELASYTNEGEIEWQTLTFELGNLQGNTTQIRFEASGQDNDRINDWNIDNIVLDGTPMQSFELSPTSADFGQQMTGTISQPQIFVYSNTGIQPVIVSGTSISGSHSGAFILEDTQQYPLTLDPGQNKQLSIKFAPQEAALASAELIVSTSAGNYSASLSGIGFDEFVGTVPFAEDWSSSSFETQQWTFNQNQTNWRIQTNSGNPAPSARFNFSPIVTNYSISLISPRIQVPSSSQSLALSYDLKLSDFQSGGTELFKVYVWNGQTWHQISVVSNSGNTTWQTHIYDISTFIGQEIRLKFEASGENSGYISNWEVDNISLQFIDWPKITVSPTELVQNLLMGSTATEQVVIGNEGTGILTFSTSVVYDAASGSNNWLQITPSQGSVASGGQLPLDVTFNTQGLQGLGANFTASINISSNDPDLPEITVQANLSILLSLDGISITKINVYPVPANEMLYCSGVDEIRKIQFFSSSGQLIFEQMPRGHSTIQINTTPFTNGTYLLKLFPVSGKPIQHQIIITH